MAQRLQDLLEESGRMNKGSSSHDVEEGVQRNSIVAGLFIKAMFCSTELFEMGMPFWKFDGSSNLDLSMFLNETTDKLSVEWAELPLL